MTTAIRYDASALVSRTDFSFLQIISHSFTLIAANLLPVFPKASPSDGFHFLYWQISHLLIIRCMCLTDARSASGLVGNGDN